MPLRIRERTRKPAEKAVPPPRTPLPAPGQRFKREHLTPISQKAYLRLSNLYNIPLEELTPSRAGRNIKSNPFIGGGYWPEKHRISFESSLIGKSGGTEDIVTFGLEEEELHSLQGPLAFHKELRRIKKYRRTKKLPPALERARKIIKSVSHFFDLKMQYATYAGIEPSAKIHHRTAESIWDAANYSPMTYLTAPLAFLNPAFLLLVPLGTMHGYLYRAHAKHYFQRHGVDGMLLLYADPPKNWNMRRLPEKERFFLEKDLLKENGGFTKAGIKYLREKVPRQELVETIRLLREEPDELFDRAVAKWEAQKAKRREG